MIYYLCPDNIKPSWGIGVIYYHVKALNELGHQTYLLHQKQGFNLTWLQLDLPVKYVENFTANQLSSNDCLVVPEIMVNDDFVLNCKAKKILFIQAMGFVFENLPIHKTHKSIGFESIMVIMPHMKTIVEKFIGIPVFMIPPMVADYFHDKQNVNKRKKKIVMYPKFNQIDFSIVNNLLRRKIGNDRIKKAIGIDWRVVLLEGLSHKEVAGFFDKASFFISLNTFEALNTSVIEAMARGCIVFCYEGFGPRDFLQNEKNAFVFANNEPYKLVEKIYDVLDHPDQYEKQLQIMREEGIKTANQYTYDIMKSEIEKNIKLLNN
jgi:hypothetical protein